MAKEILDQNIGGKSQEELELLELQKIQTRDNRDLASEEMARMKELESELYGKATGEERKEYLELTRKQTGSVDWTPEKAERLSELEKKVERK